MNFLNKPGETGVTNGDGSAVNETEPGPGAKYIEGDDTEIVNEEDQNQVVNAQPVEEFISNVVNNESTETVEGPGDNQVEQ